jgi:hypothetical protein
MTLAIILVVLAAIALTVILRISFPRALRLSAHAGSDNRIEPLDVEAFRNLVDPAEREYLRRRLPPAEFREVQRKRLRATAAYIQIVGRNAAILVEMAQGALASDNPQTAEAARQLIDNALLLRRNAAFALYRTYLAMAWPDSNSAADRILHGYVQLNGSAMLLGRLQNPSAPIRISAS